ncbi:hypothetical protein scyTo_0024725, partial [Scyliorhinus torazame]|nr:hypothetical protein [Scyliorhinus torazame]
YTVKEARKDNQRFYVTGAPRYGHKGHVFIFSTGTRRALSDQVNGEQIGSYFGSELCPVDLDRDGQTDLLLVAAPMYHSQQNGGIVYVYRMESRVSLFLREQVASPGYVLECGRVVGDRVLRKEVD